MTPSTAVAGETRGRWVPGALARAVWPVGAVAAIAAVYPALTRDAYHLRLGTEVLIQALLASSLNLLVGAAGMVSLGHAAFFGVGAYTAGLLLLRLDVGLPVALAAAVAVAGLLALAVGAFAVRAAEIYFAMLTLAFAQLVFVVAYYWRELTGGDDGLVGIPLGRQWLPGFGKVDLADPLTYHVLVLGLVAGGLLLLRVVVGSPFGLALHGIGENRDRLVFLGAEVHRLRLRAFVLAGALAGLAGGLWAPFQGFISPELMYWTKSAEILLATILGGLGTFWGPSVGAGLVLTLKDTLLAHTERWKLVLGAVLLLTVLFLPGGLVGSLPPRARAGVDRRA